MKKEQHSENLRHSESGEVGGCPLRAGMERHVWPAGNEEAIVTRTSSDTIFGPKGLGFGNTFWTTIISWLARNGIQEQTGSNPDQTNIANCVKGWGQGPYSSRVFNAESGIDEAQLERLISHLQGISAEFGVPDQRITDDVLAAFVSTQNPKPYSTWDGMREAKSFRDRVGARFRGHIQWQAFVTLCGQIDRNGVKHVTPELLRTFFNSEEPFFQRVSDRRQGLREGTLAPGDQSGILADVPSHIDPEATDLGYKKNKSGLWIVLKIIYYMLFHRQSRLGSLPGT